MTSATLATAGGVSLAVGLSFLLVARAIRRMPAHGPDRTAIMAFAAWWAALAAYLIVQGGLTLAAAGGRLDASWYDASRWITIPVLCTGVWGLTSYLLYIYTGKRRVFFAVAGFYAVVAALFFAAHAGAAGAVEIKQWVVTEDDSGTLYRIVYVLVGAPPILAAFAYLLLLRQVEDRTQRYRIILVAAAILAYVGSGLAARLAAGDAIVFMTLVVFGAIAAAASLLAYHPPRKWRAWLERAPEEEERMAEGRRLRMQQRAMQLI